MPHCSKSPAVSPCHGLWRRFHQERSGNVVVMFALIALPFISLVGGALDYSRSLQVKSELQNTVDAALLAAATRMNIDSDAEVEEIMRAYIEKNTREHNYKGTIAISGITVDSGSGKISVTASSSVSTTFLKLVDVNQLSVSVFSEAIVGNRSFEIALVLDNSGSMQGQKIEDLRTAASNLTKIMFGDKLVHPKVNIGVVPFASLVNVGTEYDTAAWMDTAGASSIHKSIYTGSKTRFELYDTMNNVAWGGCVEARAAPYDTDDTTPTNGEPDTFFVPSFAPDEPDGNFQYLNSYLNDNDGTCAADDDIDNGSCSNANAASCPKRQEKICKYNNETPDTSLANGTRRGPNQLCDTTPINPLVNIKGDIDTALSGMQAYGGTNIHQGVAWGWRVLSPDAPFTEGKDYSDEDNAKIMVLMTDGHNDMIDRPTHSKSMYSAYGFYADGRLDTDGDESDEAMEEAINVKTAQTCTNAKAAGITIYTIAFEVSDDPTLDMLRDCASNPGMAFASGSGTELISTFEQIAAQINRLRLSK